MADVAGILVAHLVAAMAFASPPGDPGSLSPTVELLAILVSLPAWVLLARLFGMYDRDDGAGGHSTVDDVPSVVTVVTVGVWLILATASLLGVAEPYLTRLVCFWLSAIVFILFFRAVARFVFARNTRFVQNVLILGADEIGQRVASKILRHPEYGINVVGFVDSGPALMREDIGDLSIIGGQGDLERLIDAHDVERVIVAFSQEDLLKLIDELRLLRTRNIQVDLVPRFYDLVGPGAGFHTVEGLPLVSLAPTRLNRSQRAFKRTLDVVLSGLGLLLLAPVFAFAVVRIRRESSGPAFFRQERVGLNGRPFNILKFRTMLTAARLDDPVLAQEFARNFKLRVDPRVTPFGEWLRRTSLDELPQLWNVLKGEMSLVGPRPLVPAEADLWRGLAGDLLVVKPGMTGYWQINGRSDADYAERVRLELSYVADYTPGLDMSILAKTLGVIITNRGAC